MWHPPGGMRIPDRGSTTGAATWTDREPASGLPRRGERSESIPPSPPYFKKSSYASTGFFFACGTRWGGDENPRPGFDNWQRQLDRPRACERAAPQGRAKRVNPPLTAIFEMRACTQVQALFFYILRWGGDENPRPGFDNWQRQLNRPRACERAAPTKTPGAFLNNACVGPAGARPMDGPSNGERSESIPPHRHIRDESLYASTGSFLLYSPLGGGMRTPDRGSTTGATTWTERKRQT